MPKQMTPFQKKIIQAHIEAQKDSSWNSRPIHNAQDFKAAMLAGETSIEVYEAIDAWQSPFYAIVSRQNWNGHRHISVGHNHQISLGFTKLLYHFNIK